MPKQQTLGKGANRITFEWGKFIIMARFHFILTKLQDDINQALPVFPAIKIGFVYYLAPV